MAPAFDNPFTRKKRQALEAERRAIEAQQQQLKAMQEQARRVAQATAAGTNLGARNSGVQHTATSIRPSSSSGKPVSVLELLNAGQDLASRLRNMSATNMEAFPILNEAQRNRECWLGMCGFIKSSTAVNPPCATFHAHRVAVQRLKDAVKAMPMADQEVWQL
jgi:multidrug efflux pump subunit AcrA (membrane-fusion protein)